jgi:cytochrome P450
MRPFTFSNGVTVPAGTLISIPASAAHRDERIFPNPDKFDGFRFAKLRETEGDYNEQIPDGLHVQRIFAFWTGATHVVGISTRGS